MEISDELKAFFSANGKKGGNINKKKGSEYFKWVVSHRKNAKSKVGDSPTDPSETEHPTPASQS